MISIRGTISRSLSTGAGKSRAVALATMALLGLSAAPRAHARLLVSDYASHSVLLYNAGTGALMETFAAQNSGGLQNPNSMAFGPDGNLYVTDTNSVLRYNGLTGTFLDVFIPVGSGGLQFPSGVAFGPDGNLYVTSKGTSSVLRYDGHTGAFIDAFVPSDTGGLSYPYGLAFGPDRNLYVSSSFNHSVLRYNGGTGAFIDTFVPAGSGGLHGPLDLVFGPDSNLYVSSYDTNSVLRFSGLTGAFIDAFVPSKSGGLAQPEGLTFAPDGNLYVASRGSHSILRYNGLTGVFIDAFVAPGASATTPQFLLFTLDAPNGLTASAISSSQVNLSWTDNSDDETAFAIWRKGSLGNWTRVGVVPPNVTTFTDSSLPANTTYTYRVRAISNILASSWSNEGATTTYQAPPAAPFGLTASPVSPTQIALNWFDNSDNETAFAIWRKSGVGSFIRVGVVPPNTTTYSDFGLNPNTSYTYRVRATNNFYASDWTNEASGTTLPIPPPAAPTDLKTSDVSYSQVSLTWTDNSNNETAFAIWRKSGNGDFVRVGVVPPNSTSFTDATVDPVTSYTYRVRATNNYFASGWSNLMDVKTIQAPPLAPSDLVAIATTSTQVNLNWVDHSDNETALEVYRKSGSGDYALVGVLAPKSTSFSDTGMNPGTTYTYRVRAANDFWASAYTSEVSVTPGP